MAKRRRRKAGRRKTDKRLPGWLYMFCGLAIGLAVAAGIYVSDRRDGITVTKPKQVRPAQVETAVAEPEAKRGDEFEFDFYDMLPNLDVPVFEDRKAADRAPARAQPVRQAPVEKPGIYILQAGSFTSAEDARRREGEIALLGIRAEVRKGDANGRTVYRVYTRPLDTPDAVNRTQKRLNDAGIDTLRKRVSD